MSKRAAAVLTLVLLTVPLHADFSSIAHAIDAQHGVRRVWIPFLGIARAAVWVVSPKGVQDFQLATFEGADDVDPSALQAILRTEAGPGFAPLVQTWSRKSDEWSFIYARPTARTDRLELMILTHDNDDTVLVRVVVNADTFAREIELHPRRVANMSDH